MFAIVPVNTFGYKLMLLLHILAVIVAFAPAFVWPFASVKLETAILEGRGGDDDLFGDQGDDSVNGGAGDDSIEGGSGRDSSSGGSGLDDIDGIDDHGNHVEPGDDHGVHAPGTDDHGSHGGNHS